MTIAIAPAVTVIYWLARGWLVPLLPVFIWHKKAVVNRNRILFEEDAHSVTVHHGRWFVLDDDIVQISAIDHIKLNRSVLGKIFGYCDLTLETRSEIYQLKDVSTRQAEAFRDTILSRRSR